MAAKLLQAEEHACSIKEKENSHARELAATLQNHENAKASLTNEHAETLRRSEEAQQRRLAQKDQQLQAVKAEANKMHDVQRELDSVKAKLQGQIGEHQQALADLKQMRESDQ